MPDFSVAEVWRALAAHDPERLAVVFGEKRLTRADIGQRTDGFARALVARGLGCHRERSELRPWQSGQDHLAIYLHNGNEYLEAMLGAFKARVAPFNVNYRYVAEELQYLLSDSDATALIFHSAFAPLVEEVRQSLPHLQTLFQVADSSANGLVPNAVWYEDALRDVVPVELPIPSVDDLYILYTGGTTGMPKGVLWRQADALMECFGGSRSAQSIDEVVENADSPSRAAVIPPFMHGAAHWVALSCLHRGGTAFIPDVTEHFDAAAIWDLIERERITFVLIVGDAFGRPLLDELPRQPRDLSSLSVVLSGGATLSAAIKRQFLVHLPQIMIIDGMGASEVGGQMQHISTGGASSTGSFPPASSTAVLSDDRSRILAAGDPEVGWLAKRGPRLALGYLGDEAKTSATYPIINGERFGVPGDRARVTIDNVVELYGRESATINSGGEKIYAEEVEAALKAHPDVYDCVVTSRPSARWGNEVVAIVQHRLGAETNDASLLAEAVRHVARFKLPKAFVYVKVIRRSAAGKADYRWAKSIANP